MKYLAGADKTLQIVTFIGWSLRFAKAAAHFFLNLPGTLFDGAFSAAGAHFGVFRGVFGGGAAQRVR
jgi:hypothetical protein